jgi:hypothetical protein
MRPLEAGITGKAPVVGSAVPRADYIRLARLAARKRTTTSALLREAVTLLLDQLERADTTPP